MERRATGEQLSSGQFSHRVEGKRRRAAGGNGTQRRHLMGRDAAASAMLSKDGTNVGTGRSTGMVGWRSPQKPKGGYLRRRRQDGILPTTTSWGAGDTTTELYSLGERVET